jgi:methylthioribose-1-phosphate isomerase
MSAVESPLFEPVHWQSAGFEILDEIQVPDKLEYIQVTEVAQALDAVRVMKTRAYGQVLTFLYSAALVAQQYQGNDPAPLRERLAQLTQQFCDVRPTFDFHGLGSYVAEFFDKLPVGGSVGETIARQAREFGAQITRARSARAKRAASVLSNPARVLTHCNVSGELVAVARYCKEMGKEFSVIATETRPYLQGARLTAWELAQAGVRVSLIPDGAVAQVMARGEVNAVIVGADRSAQNGDVVNKVGTYPIARLAHEYGVPFYALVQDPRSLERGSDVAIEERPAHEILTFHGQPLVADSHSLLKARYPSFDVTPARFITQLIGLDDVYTPESFREKFQAKTANAEQAVARDGKYILLYGVPPANQYAFIISALKAEAAESILVPEMRPQLLGAQVVARELLERNAPTTLISDNMIGTLFAHGEIKKLCLFYNDFAEQGPIGICGSLLAVQLAHLHGVAVELFSGAPLDSSIFLSTDRDASTFMGKPICPAGVTLYPIEAEVVPWALFKS